MKVASCMRHRGIRLYVLNLIITHYMCTGCPRSKTGCTTPHAIIHNQTPILCDRYAKSTELMHPLVMIYENKNSFKTGDPANSGLSRTQLKLGQSIHC